MQGKYRSLPRYLVARALRTALRAAIRPLVNWQPLAAPADGYTILIGAASRLHQILPPNMELIARQDLRDLREIIVVFDTVATPALRAMVAEIRRRHPALPLRDLYYTPFQAALSRRLGLPYVYSWLSWSVGLAASQTRYAYLHDYDAFLLNPRICRDRYEAIVARDDQYVGIRWYDAANGIVAADGLATTFEMIFDAAFVRQHFRPVELFNAISVLNGRTVDFDTLLYAQTQRGRSSVLPIPEEELVHPSQVITHFTDYTQRAGYTPPPHSNLLMIPYFVSVGGHDGLLNEISAAVQTTPAAVPFFGRCLDVRRLTAAHAQWLRKQALRIEAAVFGTPRPSVATYFDRLMQVTGA
jgi:hypothetical protein